MVNYLSGVIFLLILMTFFISWIVFDILIYLPELQNKCNTLCDTQGIVIIEEIDNHYYCICKNPDVFQIK